MSEKIHINSKKKSSDYTIEIGDTLLAGCGEWTEQCLGQTAGKIAIVSNAKVYRLYGGEIEKSLKRSGFRAIVWLMKDGERYKNMRSLQNLLVVLSENGITRTDTVLALGGGVVGDLAGFAAAIYLRGVRFLQIPTTLLAMIDSSVGGKTGVNSDFGKNLIGAFHQPSGVLIDVGVLRTLPRRELTAGFCEAVKQGAISSKKLFTQTADFLSKYAPSKFSNFTDDDEFQPLLSRFIASQVAFKAQIVRQDENEVMARNDAKSRKILNFGHTFGHALEKLTNYRYFKHGEAVGHGIIFAANLSKKLEILPENELNLLNDVVHRTGKLPEIPKIDPKDILEAIKFDKKSINGSLQWILLRGIGKPVILSGKDVPQSALIETIRKIVKK